jgi:hypothetical protein
MADDCLNEVLKGPTIDNPVDEALKGSGAENADEDSIIEDLFGADPGVPVVGNADEHVVDGFGVALAGGTSVDLDEDYVKLPPVDENFAMQTARYKCGRFVESLKLVVVGEDNQFDMGEFYGHFEKVEATQNKLKNGGTTAGILLLMNSQDELVAQTLERLGQMAEIDGGVGCYDVMVGKSGVGVTVLYRKGSNSDKPFWKLASQFGGIRKLPFSGGRGQDQVDNVLRLMKKFQISCGEHITNYGIQDMGAAPVDGGELANDGKSRFQRCVDGIKKHVRWGTAAADWNEFLGAARLEEDKSQLQKDCLKVVSNLNQFVEMLSEAAKMCEPRETVNWAEPELDDFPAAVQQAIGFTLDEGSITIIQHTHEEYMRTDLHKRKSAWYCAWPGEGKKLLQMAVGREFCRRMDREHFVYGHNIDPLGNMSKYGETMNKSSFHFADMNMVTQLNKRLDVEDLKQLVRPEETAQLPARYHQAVLPKFLPRTFSYQFETIKEGNGVERLCPASYFAREGMPGLAALATGKIDQFKGLSHDHLAMARSAIIFVFPERGVFGINRTQLKVNLQEQIDEEIERGKAAMVDLRMRRASASGYSD